MAKRLIAAAESVGSEDLECGIKGLRVSSLDCYEEKSAGLAFFDFQPNRLDAHLLQLLGGGVELLDFFVGPEAHAVILALALDDDFLDLRHQAREREFGFDLE